MRFSRTKNLPYYIHTVHSPTWYFPGSSEHNASIQSVNENENENSSDNEAASALLRLRGGGGMSEGERDGIKIFKKIGGGAIETVPCDFCSFGQTNHICRKILADGKCMIEDELEKICGKAICLGCSEKVESV